MPPLQCSLDEARQEGMQKGKHLGKQEGVQQGIQQGVQQVIVNMLKHKMDTSVIRKVTGLSETQIKKLQKKYHKQ